MRNLTSISAVAVAAFFATSAHASDLGSYKDPTSAEYSAPVRANWSGLYIGGRIGLGKDRHELRVDEYDEPECTAPGSVFSDYSDGPRCDYKKDGPGANDIKSLGDGEFQCNGNVSDSPKVSAATLDEANELCDDLAVKGHVNKIAETLFQQTLTDSGLFYGGTIGADLQRDRFVFGVFGYYDVGDTSVNLDSIDFTGHNIEHDGEWAIGVRGGFLVNDRLLAYITAAYKQVDLSVDGPSLEGLKKDFTVDGFEAGVGAEFLVVDNFSLGVEYTHFFGGEETFFNTCASTGCVAGDVKATDDFSQDKVMLIGRFRFN